MNCENCNQEFQPTKTNGTLQKYCSLICRNKAANNRRIDKIIERHDEKISKTYRIEKGTENKEIPINGYRESNFHNAGYSGQDIQHTTNNNNTERQNDYFRSQSNLSMQYNIGHIENLYETKSLLSISNYELSKAQEKIQNLQSELDKYYEEDDEIEKLELAQKEAPQHEKILKSFADMFREDPVNTTNMVKTLVPSIIGGITDMFKTKTNDKTN